MLMVLVLACSRGPGAEVVPPEELVEDSIYSGEWRVPTPEDLIGLDYPVNEDGHYIVYRDSMVEATADPYQRDALYAAGGCSGLMLACLDPEARNMLGCFENIRTCETDTPWQEAAFCCDPSCKDAYLANRANGADPANAFTGAVLEDGSCMPGLDEMMEEGT